jgi:tetratricopeptide (TPR) repeat protein
MYRIRRETGKGMQEAMQLLMDTVENDPTSALAWAGLAYGYGELGHSPFPKSGAYPRAKAAADRALELDPDLAEAHLAVAMYRLYYEWDFVAAEQAFEKAISINPSLVTAHYHLAWLFELYGRDDDAIRLGELTKELDPLSPFYSAWLAEQYRDAGMLDAAIEEAEAALSLRQNYPVANFVLGETYADLGDFDKAIEYHERLKNNYYWSFALAATLGAAGRKEEALEIAKKYQKDGNSLVLVLIYASMKDYDAAYTWLLKAREDKIPWYPWLLKWYPQTRGLHHDPRVDELAAELGLETL